MVRTPGRGAGEDNESSGRSFQDKDTAPPGPPPYHLHVLVRLDLHIVTGWSDEEGVRRWGRLFPPRDKSREPLPVSDARVQSRLEDRPMISFGNAFESPGDRLL
jgi:hypothetical protein